MKPPSPCIDCHTLTRGTRCPPCAAAWKKRRGNSGWDWTRTAAAARERDAHMCMCRGCSDCTAPSVPGLGCSAPGTEVNHIVPLYLGGSNALSNLETLCHDCHALLSAR